MSGVMIHQWMSDIGYRQLVQLRGRPARPPARFSHLADFYV